MSDEKKDPTPEEPREPVVYASPVKRAWAWVCIVYVLIFMATFTYYLATARILIGIGPLLLCPALGGLGPFLWGIPGSCRCIMRWATTILYG